MFNDGAEEEEGEEQEEEGVSTERSKWSYHGVLVSPQSPQTDHCPADRSTEDRRWSMGLRTDRDKNIIE